MKLIPFVLPVMRLFFYHLTHFMSLKSVGVSFKINVYLFMSCMKKQSVGTRWHSWLRCCSTSRKVAGSIPNGVIGVFHWHNPSGRTMALGSTQPLTEMSTRNGGKGGRCVEMTTLPPSCADCLEIWESQPPGAIRACLRMHRNCFTSYVTPRSLVGKFLLKYLNGTPQKRLSS
jgi:hypothetical protein